MHGFAIATNAVNAVNAMNAGLTCSHTCLSWISFVTSVALGGKQTEEFFMYPNDLLSRLQFVERRIVLNRCV